MRRKGKKVVKPAGSEWNSDSMKEATSILSSGTTCRPQVVKLAVVPTLTAKRHAKCLTTKALSTEESPVTGAFFFLFWR